jgi:hypothetical protein
MRWIAALGLVLFFSCTVALIKWQLGIPFLSTVEAGGVLYPGTPSIATAMTARHFWETGSFSQPVFAEARKLAIRLSKAEPGKVIIPDLYATGRDGTLWPKHCLLISILAAPFYGLLGVAGIWLFNQLLLFGLFCAMLKLAGEIAGERPAFYACTLFTLLSNIFWGYSYTLSYDVLAAACILGGMALFPRHPFTSGLLWAASLWIRATHLFFLPFAAAIAVRHLRLKPDSPEMRKLAGGLVLGCLPWIAFNAVVFGHPIGGAYQASDYFLNGESHPDLQTHVFQLHYLLDGWKTRLFGFPEGLFSGNPVYLALLFLPFTLRHPMRFPLWMLSAAAAGFAFLMLCFSYWERCGGDRYVLASTALMVLPLAAFVEAAMQKIETLLARKGAAGES